MSSVALAALLEELERQERNNPRDDRVRLAVQVRAQDACEYCLMPTIGQFHIDHIIPPSRWEHDKGGNLPAWPPETPRGGPDTSRQLRLGLPILQFGKGTAGLGSSWETNRPSFRSPEGPLERTFRLPPQVPLHHRRIAHRARDRVRPSTQRFTT